MSRPLIRIHDTTRNEVIDREMNATEFAEWERLQLEEAERQASVASVAASRNSALAKLAALGLTEAEVAALIGA